ncbi:MAG TPA: tripartite tricarboxylate transporter substrate binding protein, partial [Cupriavidus sp.]|nr:tripartite tricarboxylate transporter substrate binding protein [Cupriavidus sp.]
MKHSHQQRRRIGFNGVIFGMLVCLATWLPGADAAPTDAYPSKPIRMIVPYP